MKQWWARYKESRAERRRIADANMQRFVEALEHMRLEELERREAKRLMKAAIKGQSSSLSLLVIIVSMFLPDSYALLILGDLAEIYPALNRKQGKIRASFHIYKQVLCSIPPIVWQSIKAGDGGWLLSKAVWVLVFVYGLLLIVLISDSGFVQEIDPNDPLWFLFSVI